MSQRSVLVGQDDHLPLCFLIHDGARKQSRCLCIDENARSLITKYLISVKICEIQGVQRIVTAAEMELKIFLFCWIS